MQMMTILRSVVAVGIMATSLGCAGGNGSNSGNPPVQHSVSLSWTASTTSGVGYNIYRAKYSTSCGSFSKVNATPNAATSYTDDTVVKATSYCYGVKAVNTANQESDYSNVVSNVSIPAQ